jgi:hypothetical protein
MQAKNHAPAAVFGGGTLPMGHHPGFGKWCKVPLGSHSSAKGINHTTHIILQELEALAAVPTADNMHSTEQQTTQHSR